MVLYVNMMNLILIGPQGSGKGTQASKIISKYNLYHVEMGALIRKRAQQPDPKAEIIDHLANKKGILLPDGIALDMIFDELTNHLSTNGYLFDGFPRTINQYQALRQLFEQKNLILSAVLYLEISDTESIKRLESRRVCSTCGKGYSLLLNPDIQACICGGVLLQRSDDVKVAIRQRLALYHASTQPILSLMQQDKVLITINGEQSEEAIFSEIKSKLIHFEQLSK